MAALIPPDHPDAPKYWRYETGGDLRPAIERYLEHPRKVTVRDVVLIRAYIRQWIDSPVWDANPHATAESRRVLAALRIRATGISNLADISAWFAAAASNGLDPL